MQEENYIAFTKGKIYEGYEAKLKDQWSFKKVIRAVNDQNERHIIKEIETDKLNEFFNMHFEEVKKCGEC
ncbi:hypothetical protein BC351_01205 [Paenibacillus ferrarius]|uniref:Uncharacterized protein n=2 Tax=Paenibacillus ferrarius TaxID=1469647 RepID=A0A1V4HTF0_9BACL|nr:hypothetical protein BC351_01205 [Paenibacillus ferrarius]